MICNKVSLFSFVAILIFSCSVRAMDPYLYPKEHPSDNETELPTFTSRSNQKDTSDKLMQRQNNSTNNNSSLTKQCIKLWRYCSPSPKRFKYLIFGVIALAGAGGLISDFIAIDQIAYQPTIYSTIALPSNTISQTSFFYDLPNNCDAALIKCDSQEIEKFNEVCERYYQRNYTKRGLNKRQGRGGGSNGGRGGGYSTVSRYHMTPPANCKEACDESSNPTECNQMAISDQAIVIQQCQFEESQMSESKTNAVKADMSSLVFHTIALVAPVIGTINECFS